MPGFVEWGLELIQRASSDLSPDVEAAIRKSREAEPEGSTARNVLARNNIFSLCGPSQIAVKKKPISMSIDHNLFHGDSGIKGDAAVAGDPKFVNPAEGDFRLQPGSPAIGRGSSDGAPRVDIAGTVRPPGACDIGAYQTSAATQHVSRAAASAK